MNTLQTRNDLVSRALKDCPEAIPFLIAAWSGARFFTGPVALGATETRILSELGLQVVQGYPAEQDPTLTPFDLFLLNDPSGEDHPFLPGLDLTREALAKSLPFLAHFFEEYRGVWGLLAYAPRMVKGAAAERPVPALFLDRDGTIIELVPYIVDPSLVRLKPGATELMHWARAQGYKLVCVTNQSGIGREYYDWEIFDRVQEEMHRRLEAEGLALDASFAAGYHAESKIAEGHYGPRLRKPSPGMLHWASRLLNLDLSRSIMVGDSDVDVGAGRRAGCRHVYQITANQTLADILRKLSAE